MSEIWRRCFHDSDSYISFFYREAFDFITPYVYAVDGVPVSMLHLFDASFVNGASRLKARYIYAGSTHPDHRRSGYYAALFRYIENEARANGSVLFGKPALREMIPYYQTLGFAQDACFRLVSVCPGESVKLNAYPASPEEYNRMREQAFSVHPHVEWQDRHVRFCIEENAFFGGKTLALELDGSLRFLMAAKQDRVLRISETDLSPSELRRIGGALCALFDAELIRAYLPDYCCDEGEEIVSSLVYNAPLDNTYVNLLMI